VREVVGPEDYVAIDEVPRTDAVGKFDKKVLRAQLAEGKLSSRQHTLSA